MVFFIGNINLAPSVYSLEYICLSSTNSPMCRMQI